MNYAAAYEAKFAGTEKWANEHAAVAEFLEEVPPGSVVLDCPVGTGRFIPLYDELGLLCFGVDISPDMLASAKRKCAGIGRPIRLEAGSLFDLKHQADVAVCVRFLGDWLDPDRLHDALAALRRCAPRIICGFRHTAVAQPGKRWPYARADFEALMQPYYIERSIPLDATGYWMHLCVC